MTEADWMAATNPRPMLEFLRDKASDRKLRLFAVACGWRVVEWMVDERSRQALSVSEQYADGLVGRKALAAARRSAFSATRACEAAPPVGTFHPDASHPAVVALYAADDTAKYGAVGVAMNTAGTASSLVWNIRKGNAESEEMGA